MRHPASAAGTAQATRDSTPPPRSWQGPAGPRVARAHVLPGRRSVANDLRSSFDALGQLLGLGPSEPGVDPLFRQSSDLTDLHPRTLRQSRGFQLESEREPRPLGLAGHRHRDPGAGSCVENLVAQDQNRPDAECREAAPDVAWAGPPAGHRHARRDPARRHETRFREAEFV